MQATIPGRLRPGQSPCDEGRIREDQRRLRSRVRAWLGVRDDFRNWLITAA